MLGQVADGPDGSPRSLLDLPDRVTVKHAYLEYVKSSEQIRLILYPADTLTQARALYTHPTAPAALLALRELNWGVEANFHFGYMAAGFLSTTTEANLEEYVSYWRERIETTAAVPREKWGAFWAELVRARFARTDDKSQFDQAFTNTARQSASPRPGLKCFYVWPLSEAERLDERKQMMATVAAQVNVMLHALGEKPLPL